jgi:dTDP-4-amino-4,6-dideoxygalactose transaminase
VNRWTGQENVLFEQEFAAFAGCRHAIAVANGTVALELALLALGIGAGDEVIVSSRTFIASASAVVMRGATPVVADIEPESQNLSAATVRPLLTPRTRAIIAVHLAGWPCDMDPLLELAHTHDIKVIEDCAQAQGASYKGRPVGSWGDVAAFSFCQDKIMTTGGEGGMLTTNDQELWQRAWAYKDHGKDYDAVFCGQPGAGFRWLHHSFGTNWRMTEMQAAIGRIALRKVPAWLVARQRHAAALTDIFRNIPGLRVTDPPAGIVHAYYKYYVFAEPEILPGFMTRDWLMTAITAAGIPCFSGSCSEIYREKAFVAAGLSPDKRLPVARRLGETSLMFLVHPTLTEEHIAQTGTVVQALMTPRPAGIPLPGKRVISRQIMKHNLAE